MKRLITLIAIATLAFVACNKEKKQDPLGTIPINLKSKTTRATTIPGDNQKLLTPYEIVRLPFLDIRCFNKENEKIVGRGFPQELRDYENNRLLMSALEAYDENHGGLQIKPDNFLAAHHALILSFEKGYGGHCDTVAYIPIKVLAKAREDIKHAFYVEKNMQKMYKLFQTAFTAIPCTGKQYLEMERKGEN